MSKGTTCAKAIQLWEERNGMKADEAETVKLYCQQPPIDRMDDSLNSLEACRYLSLSTNSILKMTPLSKLKNLQILSLARNQIVRLIGLEEIGITLKELWLSYNNIERLDGLQPCVALTTLFISNNKIRSWEEVSKLAQLPELKNLLLWGNQVYGDHTKESVKPHVVKVVPQITVLDGALIGETIRKQAQELD